ncbi:MAG TPA: phage virion morphogenesis protein [Pedobacter sp.]|uniref:phage virion morphogenesis protein n=1 Tax=Pedobacter sp. TaxID=1411316 RepID=UPI002CD4DE3F|nr:phage virion morphogenesis protein [Pedobacter sp.]HMI03073.1 phage virion morphogenesis protein [Pedobacter sp.]
MAGELNDFDRQVRRLMTVARTIPSKSATVAVNFSKERFRQQNWFNTMPDPWEKRKRRKEGTRETRADKRHVLVKSGRLMRSIRKVMSNSDRAIIGTDVPYAAAHNNGEQINAVQQVSSHNVRAHRRAAHSRTRDGRTERVKRHTVAAHTVKSFVRTIKFKMPQRQFLGNSTQLNSRIEAMMTTEINKAITTT